MDINNSSKNISSKKELLPLSEFLLLNKVSKEYLPFQFNLIQGKPQINVGASAPVFIQVKQYQTTQYLPHSYHRPISRLVSLDLFEDKETGLEEESKQSGQYIDGFIENDSSQNIGSKMNQYFVLFQNCLLTKGVSRSVISDLQREYYEFIPNDLLDILERYSDQTLGEIVRIFGKENEDILLEYYNFLIDAGFGFWANSKEEVACFPPMNLFWDAPAEITNAIIDIGQDSKHPFKKIFDELALLGCQHIQVRAFTPQSLVFFENLLLLLEGSIVSSLEIIACDSRDFGETDLIGLVSTYPRIHNICIHSANKSSIISDKIFFTKERFTSETHCGVVLPHYFSLNIKSYTEGLKYNSCLNRKIAIDVSGQIKNCPSMPESYGQVGEAYLADVISQEVFRTRWSITKDQIDICKVCEFRRICSDCRAFTKNNRIKGKPSKCSYDPYTTEWSKAD